MSNVPVKKREIRPKTAFAGLNWRCQHGICLRILEIRSLPGNLLRKNTERYLSVTELPISLNLIRLTFSYTRQWFFHSSKYCKMHIF